MQTWLCHDLVVCVMWSADVQFDTTGLVTYDRQILKVSPEEIADANSALYQAIPAAA